MSNMAQYLNPDNPATTSAGAEKSPLAMLAATCENIGMPSSTKVDGGIRPYGSSKRSPAGGPFAAAEHHGHQQRHAHHQAGRPTTAPKVDPSLHAGLSLPHHAGALAAAAAAAAAAAHPPLPPVSDCNGATLAALASLNSLLLPTPSLGGLPRLCTDPTCKGLCPSALTACPLGCAGCPPLPPLMPTSLYGPPTSSLTPGSDWASLLLAAYGPYLPAGSSSPVAALPVVPPTSSAANGEQAVERAGSSSSTRDDTAGSQQHVCNWVSSSGPCHKHFTSAEQLLAHLLTHTACGKQTAQSSGGGKLPSASTSAGGSRHHPYSVGSGALSLPLRPSPVGRLERAVHAQPPQPVPAPSSHAAAWANYAALLYGQRLPPLS